MREKAGDRKRNISIALFHHRFGIKRFIYYLYSNSLAMCSLPSIFLFLTLCISNDVSKCFTDIFSYYFAHWLIAYVYIYIQTWIWKIVQMCSSVLRLKQRVFIHTFGMFYLIFCWFFFTWFSVFFIGSIFVYFHSKLFCTQISTCGAAQYYMPYPILFHFVHFRWNLSKSYPIIIVYASLQILYSIKLNGIQIKWHDRLFNSEIRL